MPNLGQLGQYHEHCSYTEEFYIDITTVLFIFYGNHISRKSTKIHINLFPLHSSSAETLWMDISDTEEEQIWYLHSTHVATFEKWPNGVKPFNTSRNNGVYSRKFHSWADATPDEIHGFVCEVTRSNSNTL